MSDHDPGACESCGHPLPPVLARIARERAALTEIHRLIEAHGAAVRAGGKPSEEALRRAMSEASKALAKEKP